MLSVVTLLSVIVAVELTYWIPERNIIRCDLDKAGILNVGLTKST